MKANTSEKYMTFYHGTNKENWDAIQREGILYGRRYIIDNNGNIIKEVSRCTYLATDLEEAKCYGDVILQVEYDPFRHKEKNNYIKGCWQVRVYEPIPISKIQEMKIIKGKSSPAIKKIVDSLTSEDMEEAKKELEQDSEEEH